LPYVPKKPQSLIRLKTEKLFAANDMEALAFVMVAASSSLDAGMAPRRRGVAETALSIESQLAG
jgi:hypothetical protein